MSLALHLPRADAGRIGVTEATAVLAAIGRATWRQALAVTSLLAASIGGDKGGVMQRVITEALAGEAGEPTEVERLGKRIIAEREALEAQHRALLRKTAGYKSTT